MSYHSDTLAFKKAELLAVLQAIDSGFSFETIEPIQVKEVVVSNNRTGLDNYKTLLFKKPLLSIYESASIISEINPCLIVACNNEYESKIEYPNWGNALNYIESCIHSGLLERDEFNINCIKRDDLKAFLASQDIIIVGFNDNLPTQEPIGYGQPSIQQTEPNFENLNAEISRLRKEIEDRDKTAIELQNHIKELEADQPNEQVEIQTSQAEPKLSTREENNIIKVLAVLADMDAKIDILKPYEAHGIMARKAQLLGIEPFPSDESIKKWFSKANEYKNPK